MVDEVVVARACLGDQGDREGFDHPSFDHVVGDEVARILPQTLCLTKRSVSPVGWSARPTRSSWISNR